MLRQTFEKVKHKFTPPHPYTYRHHFVSFLLLHELTAVVPLPIFAYGYYTLLNQSGMISFDRLSNFDYFEKAYEKMTGYLNRKQFDEYLNPNGVVAFGLAYGTVKLMMPLRVMLSVYWTPFLTRTLVGPVFTRIKRLKIK